MANPEINEIVGPVRCDFASSKTFPNDSMTATAVLRLLAASSMSAAVVAKAFPANWLSTSAFALSNVISPAAFAAQQDNYAPTGIATAQMLRLTSTGAQDITGFTSGAVGRLMVIHNIGAANITLKDENAGSTAANRFALAGDIVLVPDNAVVVQYDSTSLRWRAVSMTGTATGAAGGDLAGSYPNPTVAQSSTAFAMTGDISPAALAAQANDYNPANLATSTIIRQDLTGSQSITGIAGGADGRLLIVQNIDAGADILTLTNASGASAAANRFAFTGDILLLGGEAAFLLYDATASRWKCFGRTMPAYGTAVNTLCQGNDARLSDARTPTGAAGGDLAGTYANPTVAQASAAFALPGDISPAALAAQANDYDPANLATAAIVRQDLTGSQSITGIAGGADGRFLIIRNIDGAADILTLSNANVASAAANRFAFTGDILLLAGEGAVLMYDATLTRWVCVGRTVPAYGTAVNTVCQGNDARLSDVRVPTGAAGGDLAGTYANPTVAQSSTAFGLTGVISPAQITASQNNYNPANLATSSGLRLDLDAAWSITGIAGGAAGRFLVLHNISGFILTLTDEDGASNAANRFSLFGNVSIRGDEVALLQYDATSTRWRLVGSPMPAGILAADTAGRALMATGYFSEAKATDAFAAQAITGAIVKNAAITTTQLASNTIQTAEVAISSGELLALRAAPKTLVAAPGAGNVLEFVCLTLIYDYGTVVYTINAPGDDFQVKYTNGAGVAVCAVVAATGMIDQASDQTRSAVPSHDVAMVTGAALVLHNEGAAEWTLGDGVCRAKVAYRIHATGL